MKSDVEVCGVCYGTGEVRFVARPWRKPEDRQAVCSYCGGRGYSFTFQPIPMPAPGVTIIHYKGQWTIDRGRS